MKTILRTLMMTGLTMTAFGADLVLHFQVEFPFIVGKQLMPAGRYSIREMTSGAQGLMVENAAARKSAFLALPVRDSAKETDSRQISFGCGESGCTIHSVTNLSYGLRYGSTKAKKSTEKLVAVQLGSRSANVE